MYARWIRSFVFVFVLGLIATGLAHAQQLGWNVATPDIMDPDQVGLVHIQYVRPWRTSSGTSAIAVFQGLYGLGHNTEIGLNVAGIDERHIGDSPLFMDAALKWRPWQTNINKTTFGFIVGDNVGIGTKDPVSGHVRNFVYSSAFLQMPFGMRISGGPYYATRDVFDEHARTGGQVTFEQLLPFAPVAFVADWQSGHIGQFTYGLTFTRQNISIGIGYGLSNNGRANDNLVIFGALKF